MRALTTLVTAATALALGAGRAVACPSCYGSLESKVLDTYYLSTVMLSLLPFALVAAITALGWLLARQLSVPADAPTVTLPARLGEGVTSPSDADRG
jgi:hypothetical protein